jgi:hypothetical protein
LKEINICNLTEIFFIIKPILQCRLAMAAAWWRQWQLGNTGGGGGSMVSVTVAAAWG